MPFPVKSVVSVVPCTDVYRSVFVFNKRLHVYIAQRMPFSVGFHHGDVLARKLMEGACCGVYNSDGLIGTNPHIAVFCSEQSVNLALVVAFQIISREASKFLVHTYQSVFCSNPQTVVVVFGHRENLVVGQDIRRLGIGAIGVETIAVV